MILMPQIFDVTANENARCKRNELEFNVYKWENAYSKDLNAWIFFYDFLYIY